MTVPRYVALCKADQTFGLPPGVTVVWLEQGRVHRVFFHSRGEFVVGVRTAEMHYEIARVLAARIRSARGVGNTRTLDA